MTNKYCIDTSSLINFVEYYPEDIFPGMLENMNNLIDKGLLVASSEVLDELKKKDDKIFKWLKSKPDSIIEIDQNIQNEVVYIMQKYPLLVNIDTGNSKADPFIIATAKTLKLIVITEEKPRSPKKIPYICKQEDIKCITLVELMREQGWIFN